MKLATLRDGTPDGRLLVVSRDLSTATTAPVASMQAAIELWDEVEPELAALYAALNDVTANDPQPLDWSLLGAPLPRAWQWLDGSAYPSHGKLMQKAFDLPPIKTDRPLMYQGMSDRFLGPNDAVTLPSEADGIDFEGEFGVIVGAVSMGTNRESALDHVRLIVQINDWSLRAIAPIEMKTGFGWIQAKPACSMAPIAITPDELGAAWTEGRIALSLRTELNDTLFGDVPGAEGMEYGFADLIAHAARSRDLVPGTIIGSGTVSSAAYETVGSSCIAERRAIEMITNGAAHTPFLRSGDRVRMTAALADGSLAFGAIDQRVHVDKQAAG